MNNALEKWFEKKSMNPLRDFSDLQKSFDRLYDEFMNMKLKNGFADFGFSPSCEISEEGNEYVIKADLPGVTKEQVKVEADGDQLTIRAERKEEKKSENKKKYMSEVKYGSYQRTFTLPSMVDEKKVSAKFENGVLTVTVPKSESNKAKQITVQ